MRFVVPMLVVLGCGGERIAGFGEETSESETGAELELGEIAWTYESDIQPQVLEATVEGVLVGGVRWSWRDPEWPDSEAEVFELDQQGTRVWTSTWDPELPVPRWIYALAYDQLGVWVALDEHHGCIDWCPTTTLARLDSTGHELWRSEFSSSANAWALHTIGTDAIVVSSDYFAPQAELRRIDASGEVLWEWVLDSEMVVSWDVELFEGALWVVGGTGFDPAVSEPWIARFDPETGELLEVLETELPSGTVWSANELPTGLAIMADERLWVLDGSGAALWNRSLAPAPNSSFCKFDARHDGRSASSCGGWVEVIDPWSQPLWSWDPEDEHWTDVAVGTWLFLAEGASLAPDVPGRVHALQID